MRDIRYLNSFYLLQEKLNANKEFLTPKDLYLELIQWSKLLMETKDLRVQSLYFEYLSYFKKFDVNDYLMEPLWYSFEELVNVDLLGDFSGNLDSLVLRVRGILWEIIAFKTKRDCKILPIDNLRMLTNERKSEIFFSCDVCGYTENVKGEKVKLLEVLYPATKLQALGIELMV